MQPVQQVLPGPDEEWQPPLDHPEYCETWNIPITPMIPMNLVESSAPTLMRAAAAQVHSTALQPELRSQGPGNQEHGQYALPWQNADNADKPASFKSYPSPTSLPASTRTLAHSLLILLNVLDIVCRHCRQ